MMKSKTVSLCFFFSSRRRHTRCSRDWSSDVCSSDLVSRPPKGGGMPRRKSLVTVIRELVQEEVGTAINSLLGGGKPKAKNGRRRRRKIGRASCRERV